MMKKPLQMAPIMKSSKAGGFKSLAISKNQSENAQALDEQPKMPVIQAGSKSTLSNISPHLQPKLKGS